MPPHRRFALFDYGFRPFFLLAGAYAVVAMSIWLWMFQAGLSLHAMPPQWWHGHEMLFGFVSAAIAGFMLTAVPSWTGRRGFAGTPLAVLVALWLLGRIAFAAAGVVHDAVLVVAELAFIPVLVLVIAPSLLRTTNRNTPLLLVLATFWALDATFLWALLHDDFLLARRALIGALDVVLLLVTIIGGRIVPAFTSNALKLAGAPSNVRSRQGVERAVVASMFILVVAGLAGAPVAIMAAVAAVAAVAHAVRIAGWQTHRTLRSPIVWVLHAAYLWLPVGLALRALHLVGNFGFAAHWLHALGAGAAATMIFAVMTRASLGHTGRPLHAPAAIAAAYGLLILAAVVRVFGPALLPVDYSLNMFVAMALWISAFVLFVVVYTPILVRPRVDGKPG